VLGFFPSLAEFFSGMTKILSGFFGFVFRGL